MILHCKGYKRTLQTTSHHWWFGSKPWDPLCVGRYVYPQGLHSSPGWVAGAASSGCASSGATIDGQGRKKQCLRCVNLRFYHPTPTRSSLNRPPTGQLSGVAKTRPSCLSSSCWAPQFRCSLLQNHSERSTNVPSLPIRRC